MLLNNFFAFILLMQRFFEIDALRGIAVIAMIAFHAFFDLNFFAGYRFPLYGGALFALGRFAAVAFIFIVGVSLAISYNRVKSDKKGIELFKKFLFRGAKIFCLGLVITAATWLLFPSSFIAFGVLHLIGLAIILSFPFIGKKKTSLFTGIALIALGFWLQQFSFPFTWLLWLGFSPGNFYTFDYFPLLPWFGVVLLGVFFGSILYPNAERGFRITDLSKNKLVGFFSFLGRHSLLIYFLHQPLLVALILLLK